MDYHLDHEIRLSEESKFKNLYSWSLQEFSKDGQQMGADQIPWPWSLYFSASELRHNKSVKIERSRESDGEVEGYKSAEESESITAILHPGICSDGKWLERDTIYSMLGTKRTIDYFSLRIYRLEEADANERCHLWGCVSYTSEVDFRDETEDDTVEIFIQLSPKKFDDLREMVNGRNVEIFQVRLNGVSGFYSEWSPSVRANKVKILASGEEQNVILPEGCGIAPPRLGEVEEFELTAMQRRKLDIKQDLRPVNVNKLFEEESGEQDQFPLEEIAPEKSDPNRVMLADILKNGHAISKLSTPLWLIVFLLVVLLFR